MRIMHVCLSNFYIDGFNYQENMLVREHVQAGHEVKVLASTENYNSQGQLTYSEPGEYHVADGADVVRLPYRKLAPPALMRKIRAYPSVYQQLTRFEPDVILFHGLCAWELLTVLQYKKNNPSVKLYLDSHEDFNNSARSFLSKYILHYLFYRTVFRKAVNHVEKVLCISIETINFVKDFYRCPEDKIKYFPLGGQIFNDADYQKFRNASRIKYNLEDSNLVFFQSGKFDKKKKIIESLTTFLETPYNKNIRYFIAGVLQDDVKEEAEKLIAKDERIVFLGWQNSEELLQFLCATDVYVQPGSQSATLQNSICCRCAVIVDDVPSHQPFVKDNGWLISDSGQLANAFESAIQEFNKDQLYNMQYKSFEIAKQLLDYEVMAKYLTS